MAIFAGALSAGAGSGGVTSCQVKPPSSVRRMWSWLPPRPPIAQPAALSPEGSSSLPNIFTSVIWTGCPATRRGIGAARGSVPGLSVGDGETLHRPSIALPDAGVSEKVAARVLPLGEKATFNTLPG